MRVHHVLDVHPVDVVGAEDDDVVGVLVVDQVHRLEDGIGAALVPLLACPLLCGHGRHVAPEQVRHAPGQRDVPVQRVRLVLSQDADLGEVGVGEVGQHEIDESIGAAKWHCWLGPVSRQRHQPLTLAAGKDNGQNVRSASHIPEPKSSRLLPQENRPKPRTDLDPPLWESANSGEPVPIRRVL